jgi:hypothetical protein
MVNLALHIASRTASAARNTILNVENNAARRERTRWPATLANNDIEARAGTTCCKAATARNVARRPRQRHAETGGAQDSRSRLRHATANSGNESST